MGYYRSIYAGPIIRCDGILDEKFKAVPASEAIVTYFGCPTCNRKIDNDGSLFGDMCPKHAVVGKQIEQKKKIPGRKASRHYEIIDAISDEFEVEDCLSLLQRHTAESYQDVLWLKPVSPVCPEVEDHEIDDEPAILLNEARIERQKQWLKDNFEKEIEILKLHFKKVSVDWAFVVDGC